MLLQQYPRAHPGPEGDDRSMNVIAFPRQERRETRLRGIEQCLDALGEEAEAMRLPLLAHLIAVAREAARDAADDEDC